MDAVELAGLGAGAHEPRCEGVVFTQVAAVGIEIRVLQRHEIKMVKEPLLGLVFEGQRACLGVAARTEVVALLLGHGLGADESETPGRGWPLGVAWAILLCSSAGPWQVSQLMPGSAQVVW